VAWAELASVSNRFGEQGTRYTSTTRRPITVTGGKLERVARVLALWGVYNSFITHRHPGLWSGSTQSKTSWVEKS
jgi:hypothetical protein